MDSKGIEAVILKLVLNKNILSEGRESKQVVV